MSTAKKIFSVTILPGQLQFDAPADVALLEAAALSGFAMPSSCRNGTCRTCMCRLTGGRIRYNIEWPGLSAEEKQDGYILPCIAYAESNLILDAPLAFVRRDAAPFK